MTIKIITVGNKPPAAMTSLISEYERRLPHNVRIIWHYLKHGDSGDVSTSKQQESENILRLVTKKEKVVLLDERGKQLNNSKLTGLLFDSYRDITFIIGGSHGVTDTLRQRADILWSLSELVLPHNIVRLILVEQLYRSYAISTDHPYHHE
jgi:23S rRNA (pseudouridine1915-N3)-methyltransferase